MRFAAGVFLAGAAVLGLLTSCSSGGDGGSSTTPSASETVSAPDPVVSSSSAAPSSTAAPSTSATPSPTASSSSASSSAPTAPAFTTTCTSLSVRVLKGGAIRGAEIASMQFVNDGTKACTITGAPTAVLLRNGSVIGTPSQPNTDPVRPFTLQPGDVGESLLRDFSTCNAPLSDNLRLTKPMHAGKPGSTVTEPVVLRACQLRVAPVGAPA